MYTGLEGQVEPDQLAGQPHSTQIVTWSSLPLVTWFPYYEHFICLLSLIPFFTLDGTVSSCTNKESNG